MSYPAPTLYVEPTGGLGELFIRIEGELRPVRLYYVQDDIVQGGNWSSHLLPLPGLYRLSGFQNEAWYTLLAQHENNEGRAISPTSLPVKSRPELIPDQRLISLVREDSIMYVAGRTTVFRLRVRAWAVRGVSAAIFLYRRELFGSGERDVFVAVCKPGDLDEYPESAPGDTAYFRRDTVDLYERADAHREETWQAIVDDTQELMDALELHEIYAEAAP